MDSDKLSASPAAPRSPSPPDALADSSAAASPPAGSCSPLQTASRAASPVAAYRSPRNSAATAPAAHRAPPPSTPAPAGQTRRAASRSSGSCSRNSAESARLRRRLDLCRHRWMVDLRSIELREKEQQKCSSKHNTKESAHDELRDGSLISSDSDKLQESRLQPACLFLESWATNVHCTICWQASCHVLVARRHHTR